MEGEAGWNLDGWDGGVEVVMAKRPLTGQQRQHSECDRQDHRTTGLVLVQHGLSVDLELQAGGKPGGYLVALAKPRSLAACHRGRYFTNMSGLFVRI